MLLCEWFEYEMVTLRIDLIYFQLSLEMVLLVSDWIMFKL